MLNFRALKEKAFLFVIGALTISAVLPLFHIIVNVVWRGLPPIIHAGPSFLFGTLSEGGIGPAIVGTVLLTFLSTMLGLPIAFAVGVYAYEYPESRIGRATTTLLQIMLEFPTILVGLFVMQIMVVPLGTYSALAGAFSLAIIMMPYVAVYTKESLEQIPFTYREASFSLGLSQVKAVFHVLVPIAKRGILTGVLISMAKVAGETAPLLFTIGGLYQSYPISLNRPIGSVPLLIYTLVQSPSPSDHAMAWGATLVLLIIYLAAFIPLRLSLKEVKL